MSDQIHEHPVSRTGKQARQPIEQGALADPAPRAQGELASSLGYASYLDLFESSKPAGGVGQRHWLVTAEEGGHWFLWDDVEFKIAGEFESQQAALNAVQAWSRKLQ